MSDNLYNSPESNLTTPNLPSNEPRKVPAGNGGRWLTSGIHYFLYSPGTWLASILITGIFMVILTVIPLLNILANVLAPVLAGGFMYGCHQIKQKKEFKVEHLFKGFDKKFGPLAIVGLIYVASVMGIIILVFMIMGTIGLSIGLDELNNPEALQKMSPEDILNLLILPFLIAMALIIPAMMAYWFAPSLVMLRNIQPLDAMKLSFKACMTNFVPFLVYGLMGMLIGFVFMIIIGIASAISWMLAGPLIIIGYLIILCVLIASTYIAFDDIFPNTDAELPEQDSGEQNSGEQDSMIA
ncbi:BPSS1780 family membrane protein [Aliikangiella sp. IMCC44359]|uniref:BPSS1780 family membrane protein n=1 Tax=Aliikangiella sp. IMCC44359 TaxID=3459125 RepID=UPI00403B1AF2